MTATNAPSDRALIDAAIAAGRVQRIPQGVSGYDIATGQPWSSIQAAIAAHRAWIERLPLIQSQPCQPAKRHSCKSRRSELCRAHARIEAMFNDGATYAQIAKALGFGHATIHRWCKQMGFPRRGIGAHIRRRGRRADDCRLVSRGL